MLKIKPLVLCRRIEVRGSFRGCPCVVNGSVHFHTEARREILGGAAASWREENPSQTVLSQAMHLLPGPWLCSCSGRNPAWLFAWRWLSVSCYFYSEVHWGWCAPPFAPPAPQFLGAWRPALAACGLTPETRCPFPSHSHCPSLPPHCFCRHGFPFLSVLVGLSPPSCSDYWWEAWGPCGHLHPCVSSLAIPSPSRCCP